MSNNSDRGTEYTGNDKEGAKRPLTVQEQARAMRRAGIQGSADRPILDGGRADASQSCGNAVDVH
ncbi:hypothetical protein [Curtobacterium sp. VKM Ac-2884]|uniref:hypothetical protein n=1 Tax=Curtobacterium sp. VKM Ac-2884 TaxID=2783818 RepID=UPI001889CD57|nr:hypothetical protein [Curtobacterium sp. VKM Ac-2884]MBF4604716.1 hypothetical protein [Curtobacterium sp. VKM Ac-2884]